MNDWEDLSDDELRERLKNSGCDLLLAHSFVNNRDDDKVAVLITDWLEAHR